MAEQQRGMPHTNLGRSAERQGMPSISSEHPLRRLPRDKMDALFERFFGRWPAAWELMGFPERFWDVDVEGADNEIVVRADAPGFEPKDFDIHIISRWTAAPWRARSCRTRPRQRPAHSATM
jgi:HSP20 family molecular chaperone IbpA